MPTSVVAAVLDLMDNSTVVILVDESKEQRAHGQMIESRLAAIPLPELSYGYRFRIVEGDVGFTHDWKVSVLMVESTPAVEVSLDWRRTPALKRFTTQQ